jgi:ClpP class serine protease
MDAIVRSLFARPWAIEPTHGAAFMDSLFGALSVASAGAEPERKAEVAPVADVSGVRVLSMRGPMIHRPPSFLADIGLEYTDTLGLTAQVQAADADPAVSEIIIEADTPGGMVGGVPELADAIAGTSKPLHVRVDGQLASAGVWAAAHADTITATRSSEIGSIGVYKILVDTTARQAMAGINVHLVSCGGVKGAGADGRVTPELLAEDARAVGQLKDAFVSAVSAGRGFDASSRGTGQIWLAEDAKSLHLIDKITGETPKESGMDLKQFAALAAAHPNISAADLAALCDGKTDAEISAALADRARAWLHTNCASCHRPEGATGADFDLSWRGDPSGLCVAPQRGDLGIAEAQIVAPGAPERSVLLARVGLAVERGVLLSAA